MIRDDFTAAAWAEWADIVGNDQHSFLLTTLQVEPPSSVPDEPLQRQWPLHHALPPQQQPQQPHPLPISQGVYLLRLKHQKQQDRQQQQPENDRPPPPSALESNCFTSCIIQVVSTTLLTFQKQQQPRPQAPPPNDDDAAVPLESAMKRVDMADLTTTITTTTTTTNSSISKCKTTDTTNHATVASTATHLPLVRLHPLVYEFMACLSNVCEASTSLPRRTNANAVEDENTTYQDSNDQEETGVTAHDSEREFDSTESTVVSIAPIPTHCFDVQVVPGGGLQHTGPTHPWCLDPIPSSRIVNLPSNSLITVQILYDLGDRDDCNDSSIVNDAGTALEDRIRNALHGRLIAKGCTILLVTTTGTTNGHRMSHSAVSMSTSTNRGCRLNYSLALIQDIECGAAIAATAPTVASSVPSGTAIGTSHNTANSAVQVFRVASCDRDLYDLRIVGCDTVSSDPVYNTRPPLTRGTDKSAPSSSFPTGDHDCPGYESLQQTISSLLLLTTGQHSTSTASAAAATAAAPTGILITGCAGVGKTRLMTAVVTEQPFIVHWVSVHDLILMAAWATDDVLAAAIAPPAQCQIVVLDDLDAAGEGESGGEEHLSRNDAERRLVRNAILQLLDRLALSSSTTTSTATASARYEQRSMTVVGLARSSSTLASEFVKVGRFEKEIVMLPPSQRQREEIFFHMLQSLPLSPILGLEHESQCQTWAELLATMTAGCVAVDLRRLCSSAWYKSLARRTGSAEESAVLSATTTADDTALYSSIPADALISWDDLCEAAQQCTPSQLAALDVTKPPSFLDVCDVDDWPRIHELSWKDFAGYASVKQRLYRTVVGPWRRSLKEQNASTSAVVAARPGGFIKPPSGVLFHGSSGCGKTLAAICLGASLGLPMIKVRAADVLDKWLGGSEAAIRALFARARMAAPSILFFDEIDAVASNRSNEGATADVMSRLLSTLLNEMDGVSTDGQQHAKVLVVACTNRLESLDAALLRPGRLEEHVHLSKPTESDAHAILGHWLARAPLHDTVDLEHVAQALVGQSASGADIEGTCRESVFRALRRSPATQSGGLTRVSVTLDDIEAAMVSMKLLPQ